MNDILYTRSPLPSGLAVPGGSLHNIEGYGRKRSNIFPLLAELHWQNGLISSHLDVFRELMSFSHGSLSSSFHLLPENALQDNDSTDSMPCF